MAAPYNLFSAQTTSANGTAKEIVFKDGIQRIGTFFVAGTFDSCTVSLEESPDNSTWFTVTGSSLTAKGMFTHESPMRYVRGVVASAGASTSINAGWQ